MKALTLLLLLPTLATAQSAKATWSWVAGQNQSAAQAALDKMQPKKQDNAAPPIKHARALLIIELPPTATLWIQGEKQYMTGEAQRVFESPPLQVGKTYFYTIRARGLDGSDYSTTIEVKPGHQHRVTFNGERLPQQLFQNYWPGVGNGMRSGSC